MPERITPEERLNEPHGARIAILGPYGVGKTSLALTLEAGVTLFVDVENGGLPVAGHPMDHIRLQTLTEFLDIVVRIAGPNRSFAPHEWFSQAHYDRVGGPLPGLERLRNVFIDTLTYLSVLSYRHSLQQPENTSERTGRLDQRSAYGHHARQLLLALHHLQSARSLNIILIGALETVTDEFGRVEHKLQAEGQRVPREFSGIVDVVVTMNWIDFGDGKPVRAFVCTSPNRWAFPAKDRSGRLDQIEKPDLGALIKKILPSRASHGAASGRAGSQASPVTPSTESMEKTS